MPITDSRARTDVADADRYAECTDECFIGDVVFSSLQDASAWWYLQDVKETRNSISDGREEH